MWPDAADEYGKEMADEGIWTVKMREAWHYRHARSALAVPDSCQP